MLKMFMRITLILLLMFAGANISAQTTPYQNLLDTAINTHSGSLFVHSQPLTKLRLEKEDMRYYAEELYRANVKLDKIMFAEIIEAAQNADTTVWTDNELPNCLLITHRDDNVSKKYAVAKLGLTDKQKARYYKKQINRFNASETIDRDICYYSRPVFDKSKTYAIIQWDNGHSYLGGGGAIMLYHLSGGVWREMGIVSLWKH